MVLMFMLQKLMLGQQFLKIFIECNAAQHNP